MITRLGWKATNQESSCDSDSDSSEHSVTGADQDELDDFLSFLSIKDYGSSHPPQSSDSQSSDLLLSDSQSSDSYLSDSDSDSTSIIAPPFSPVIATHDTYSDVTQQQSSNSPDASIFLDASSGIPPFSLESVISSEAEQQERLVEQSISQDVSSNTLPLNQQDTPVERLRSHGVSRSGLPCQPVSSSRSVTPAGPQLVESISDGSSSVWNGFKLVGDNIDKNYRQSFHRVDKKTTSIHCFHHYAE